MMKMSYRKKKIITSMSVDELKQRVAELEAALAAATGGSVGGGREKISAMSSEVVDSNPYSRLMALKRMGIVENYEKIRDYTVAVVGVGGFRHGGDAHQVWGGEAHPL